MELFQDSYTKNTRKGKLFPSFEEALKKLCVILKMESVNRSSQTPPSYIARQGFTSKMSSKNRCRDLFDDHVILSCVEIRDVLSIGTRCVPYPAKHAVW
jgi:hypothetical protein